VRHYRGVHLVVPPGGSFRETRHIELGPRELTIGRAPSCDVRIDVPGVDDQHATINEEAVTAIGADCAVGDVPLDAGQRRLVSPGVDIQIGSVVLALDGALPKGLGAIDVPRIRVVEGQNVGKELVLTAENHEYVIGRSPKADLVLEDREVSREHLKLVRRGYQIFIFDAASTRGSWLGRSAVYQGTRVEWDRTRMLKVGATVLSLELPEAARRAMPGVQISAPMTPEPKAPKPRPKEQAPAVPVDPGPPPAGIVAYHYQPKPQDPSVPPPPMPVLQGSVPPPPGRSPLTRTAWKKSAPTIGKFSGFLLLALAGLAILGGLFVLFSLME